MTIIIPRLLIAKWRKPFNGCQYTVHKFDRLGKSQEYFAIDELGDPSDTTYKIASYELFESLYDYDKLTWDFFGDNVEDFHVLDHKPIEKQLEEIYNTNKNKERSFE